VSGAKLENIKNTLANVAFSVIGLFILILCLGFVLQHDYIAGLVFFLIAVIAIPTASTKLEKKLNISMTRNVRFIVVLVLFIISAAALTPTTHNPVNNNTTVVSDSLQSTNGSEAIVAPSHSTPTSATSPISTPVTNNSDTSVSTSLSSANGSKAIAVPSHSIPTSTPSSISTPVSKSTSKINTKGKLEILTSPTGATIIIDGVSKGLSPIEGLPVEAGTHTVEAYLSGYSLQKEKIEIEKSATKKLLYTLVRDSNSNLTSTLTSEETPTSDTKKTLDIITSPEGAIVTVDGVSRGLSPLYGLSVGEGTHTVDLYLSGYKAKTLTIDLTNSNTQTIKWTFSPYVDSTSTPTTTATKTSTYTSTHTKTSSQYKTQTKSVTNTDNELIYASSKSEIYHAASCRYVSRIKPENLITFKSRKEAEAAGYRACKVCGG
jgi:hypothetical protein